MRVDLDHLPEAQQSELARVRQTLMDEFTNAISTSTQPWKKNGKILKIILFGSYARDDWVDEPENGYQSDFDLLVVVSHEDLTDVAGYWYIAEDKIQRDPAVLPFPGGDPIPFDGFIGGGNGGYPKWRGYGVVTARKDGFSATWSTQWIGKATDFNAAPGDIGYSTPNVFYHNAQLAFEINERTRFQLGVDNLFDRKAPYIQSFTDANTDTMTYDLLGRRFYVGFRTGF
ncbi:nucleotidyltransferase domain-containing protein [Sphingomonas sp. LM7]|uniref:nucleotidyltransferase domain-containing protein n=1 Tax=Sphingomonas sp. LM7 TaxID=1938607 RepID=UPI0012371E1E|nr:nucleotidyltransferase domain-containing protein [Sphingomonas sp. LM7]